MCSAESLEAQSTKSFSDVVCSAESLEAQSAESLSDVVPEARAVQPDANLNQGLYTLYLFGSVHRT